MRGVLSALSLFIAGSAFSFSIAVPHSAAAATATTAGPACATTGNGPLREFVQCELPNSTAFPITALSGVYFDLIPSPGTTYYFSIEKDPYTGSQYWDNGTYVTPTTNPPNHEDFYVAANAVKTNASQWDYLHATVQGQTGALVLGVTAINTN